MKKLFSFLAIIGSATLDIYSQCSDAGFCTAGSLNHIETSFEDSVSNKKEKERNISFNNALGIGERKTLIYSPQLEFNYTFIKKTAVQVKIPYNFASGNIGKANALGDLFITFTRSILKTPNTNLLFNLGTRIAVNNSNLKTSNDLPLPMPYQSSLGTNDIILGASLQHKYWLFAIGFQQPITNNNGNTFLKNKWSIDSKAQTYFESNLFERKADVMLRVEKAFKYKKSTFSIGLLPIYHINNDTYIDSNNSRISITGSKGLTLNLVAGYDYEINDKFSVSLRIGAPLIARKARPDGLTRQFVSTLSLHYKF